MRSAYVLIQTEVGKAGQVAEAIRVSTVCNGSRTWPAPTTSSLGSKRLGWMSLAG